MTLLASNPEPLVLPLLVLFIGGCCLCIFLGIALILSAKNQNSSQNAVGVVLVMLGIAPMLFLGFGWLVVWSAGK